MPRLTAIAALSLMLPVVPALADGIAPARAAELELSMVRVATAGTHPLFVRGLVDLLDEHLVGATPKALGDLGPRRSPCAEGCCPPPQRPSRPAATADQS